jgi:hypothetical protein
MTDWFRSPGWSAAAQQDFELRLARARTTSRAQYLRIKAVSLEQAGEIDGARTLLRRIVKDHAEAWPEVAFAHERLGDLARASGDQTTAQAEYRMALDTSPNLSGTTGEVHLKLGEVLFESGLGSLAEIEQLLRDASVHLALASTAFRHHVLTARLATATGDVDRRRDAAAAALGLADAVPQFSRHPTVGVVSATPSLLAELRSMAS